MLEDCGKSPFGLCLGSIHLYRVLALAQAHAPSERVIAYMVQNCVREYR